MPKRIASKPIKNANKRRNNNRRNKDPDVGLYGKQGLPKTSFRDDTRPRFNPGWNLQWLKVTRLFQFTAPPADQGGGYGKYFDPTFTPSATLLAYNSGAYAFAISDVPNVTEFTTLFDQYRIAAVKLRWEFITSSEATLTPASALNQMMTLMVYEDNDDRTSPTATNAGWQLVAQTGRAKRMVFPNKRNFFDVTCYPKYQTAELDTSATTLARSLGDGWTDAATTDVQWLGIKWIGQTNPTTATASSYNFRVTATYYLEWRARQ